MNAALIPIIIAILQYGAPFLMDLADFITKQKRLPTDKEVSAILLALPPPGT